MDTILTLCYPEISPEFLAYQALIVHSEKNNETHQWVLYDRQFRREVLPQQDLNWSVIVICTQWDIHWACQSHPPICLTVSVTDTLRQREVAVAAGIPLPAWIYCLVQVSMTICPNFNEWRCIMPQCTCAYQYKYMLDLLSGCLHDHRCQLLTSFRVQMQRCQLSLILLGQSPFLEHCPLAPVNFKEFYCLSLEEILIFVWHVFLFFLLCWFYFLL